MKPVFRRYADDGMPRFMGNLDAWTDYSDNAFSYYTVEVSP